MNGPFMITVLPDALLVNGRGAAEAGIVGHGARGAAPPAVDRRDDAVRSARQRAAGTRSCRCWRSRRRTRARSAAWPRPGTRPATRRSSSRRSTTRKCCASAPAAAKARPGIASSPPSRKSKASRVRRRAGHHRRTCWSSLRDSERLVQFAQRLQDVGKASGDDSIQQRKSLARADARPGQLRRRAQTGRTGFGAEQDGGRRGADVARHAVDAHHRSAAGSDRRRPAHGPRRRVAGPVDRRDAHQVSRRERRQGSRRHRIAWPPRSIPSCPIRPSSRTSWPPPPNRRPRCSRTTRSLKASGRPRPRC